MSTPWGRGMVFHMKRMTCFLYLLGVKNMDLVWCVPKRSIVGVFVVLLRVFSQKTVTGDNMVPLRGDHNFTTHPQNGNSWFLLGIISEFSNKHPHPIYMGVIPPSPLWQALYMYLFIPPQINFCVIVLATWCHIVQNNWTCITHSITPPLQFLSVSSFYFPILGVPPLDVMELDTELGCTHLTEGRFC